MWGCTPNGCTSIVSRMKKWLARTLSLVHFLPICQGEPGIDLFLSSAHRVLFTLLSDRLFLYFFLLSASDSACCNLLFSKSVCPCMCPFPFYPCFDCGSFSVVLSPTVKCSKGGGNCYGYSFCHCILTHNRNVQTRWYMIGSADYEFLECAASRAHFCVHFPFGCHVHSLFCPSYLDTTSLWLVMYDVRFLVSLSRLMMLLIIPMCSCTHCGRCFVKFRDVPVSRTVVCPVIVSSSKKSFHVLASIIASETQ